jgi:hypothetical protein
MYILLTDETIAFVNIPLNNMVKQSQNTPMEAQGERRYSPYSFTTSALLYMGVRGRRHAPAALLPPFPIVQDGSAKQPVWAQRLEEKSFSSAGDRT